MTSGRLTSSLTGGSRLARNSVVNLLGQGVPLLAALIAIPVLISGLGTDRFGILTLAWMLIGYFGLFDLGLGRALTHVVAQALADHPQAQAPPMVWTAIVSMFVLGVLGALLLCLIAPWLVYSVLKMPAPLQAEALFSFYLLGAGIPFVVVMAGLVGILSAFQQFGIINTIRAPTGILTYLTPLIVLPFSRSLVWVIAMLVAVRILACVAHLVACRRFMPPLRLELLAHVADLRRLFGFGVWMTVTNVIGPLMVYLDRFVIGAVISMTAVAYYATPYEMVTRLLIIPSAMLGVLFPAFAASHGRNHDRMVRLFARGTKYLALILFPVVLVITAFAHEGLQWWLGNEFARKSSPVLQWLAIGVYINSLAQVFFTFIQGTGRADLTAKLHMLELPLYLLVLWWAIANHGILGAAVAWTGRIALDGVLLFWLSGRFLGNNAALLGRMTAGLLIAVCGVGLPLLADDFAPRAAMALVISIAFAAIAWFAVLVEDERMSIKGKLGWAGN